MSIIRELYRFITNMLDENNNDFKKKLEYYYKAKPNKRRIWEDYQKGNLNSISPLNHMELFKTKFLGLYEFEDYFFYNIDGTEDLYLINCLFFLISYFKGDLTCGQFSNVSEIDCFKLNQNTSFKKYFFQRIYMYCLNKYPQFIENKLDEYIIDNPEKLDKHNQIKLETFFYSEIKKQVITQLYKCGYYNINIGLAGIEKSKSCIGSGGYGITFFTEKMKVKKIYYFTKGNQFTRKDEALNYNAARRWNDFYVKKRSQALYGAVAYIENGIHVLETPFINTQKMKAFMDCHKEWQTYIENYLLKYGILLVDIRIDGNIYIDYSKITKYCSLLRNIYILDFDEYLTRDSSKEKGISSGSQRAVAYYAFEQDMDYPDNKICFNGYDLKKKQNIEAFIIDKQMWFDENFENKKFWGKELGKMPEISLLYL